MSAEQPSIIKNRICKKDIFIVERIIPNRVFNDTPLFVCRIEWRKRCQSGKLPRH